MRRRSAQEAPAETTTNQATSPPRDPLVVTNGRCQPVNLEGIWRGCSAFLLLGGPSLNDHPKEVFRERGVLSMAVNNTAAHRQSNAFVAADPPQKFCESIFFDPRMLVFLPESKRNDSRGRLRIKQDGKFSWSPVSVLDTPSTFFFARNAEFNPATFLTTPEASWGTNKKGHEKTGRRRLLFTPFLALRLLHYLGIREVFCCGLDFNMTTEAGYAFNQERDEDAVASNWSLYKAANEELAVLRPHLDSAGFRVYNVNAKSGCHVFDYVPFDKALERVRGAVLKEPEDGYNLSGWYTKNHVDE